MTKTLGISPKLAAAVGPPLTAVVTAMILTNAVDRTSLAALAAIAIGAALGYHAPRGDTTSAAPLLPPVAFGTSNPTVTGSNPGWSSTTSTTPMIVAPSSEPDTGDDGDDHLPGDLAGRDPDAPPVDEVDVADLNHPEVH